MFFDSYPSILLFMSSFGNTECLDHIAVRLHFNFYFTLYKKILYLWEELGTWFISVVFSRFLPSFLCSLLPYYTFFFIFIFFILTLTLPVLSLCLSHLQFLQDEIRWFSFFSLKCFHPCLQDLSNSLAQFISGCCCLAVLQEATVAPMLVTNIGKCKVRKVFGSVTFSACIFWNMCKDLALWGTSAWTS